VRINSSDPG